MRGSGHGGRRRTHTFWPPVMISHYSKMPNCARQRERGRGREMKDYLFLLGGRQRVSESQWEGGRQSETSKLIPQRRTDGLTRAGASLPSPLWRAFLTPANNPTNQPTNQPCVCPVSPLWSTNRSREAAELWLWIAEGLQTHAPPLPPRRYKSR